MNKIFIILIIVMYVLMLTMEYLQVKKSRKLLHMQLKENLYEVKYLTLAADVKELEQYRQTGGTYTIPVEVMNQILSRIEEFDDIIRSMNENN